MPWAVIVLLALWALMLVPIVQTALAFLIAIVTMPVVVPVIQVAEPFIAWLMGQGVRGGMAAAITCSIIVAPFAVFFLYRCLQPGRTAKQKRRSANALILVVGLPLTIIYAWWLLPDRPGWGK